MKYFLLDENNQPTGPFSIEDLKAKKIERSSKIWQQGTENWVNAETITDLISIFSTPPVITSSFSTTHESMLDSHSAIYEEYFDLKSLDISKIDLFKKNEFLDKFNVGIAIFLHFLTLGIFTTIYCGLKYDDLPQIRFDDFDAGRAIGFLFIPFFNLYWTFVFWRTLSKKINLQFSLRSQEKPVSVGLATASCILGIIPYVGQIINFLILKPILFYQIQSASNRLVDYNMKSN